MSFYKPQRSKVKKKRSKVTLTIVSNVDFSLLQRSNLNLLQRGYFLEKRYDPSLILIHSISLVLKSDSYRWKFSYPTPPTLLPPPASRLHLLHQDMKGENALVLTGVIWTRWCDYEVWCHTTRERTPNSQNLSFGEPATLVPP